MINFVIQLVVSVWEKGKTSYGSRKLFKKFVNKEL